MPMSAEDNKQIRSIDYYIKNGIVERAKKTELQKRWLQCHRIESRI